MKILWFLLFMNSAVILFSNDITGQWWRYNRNSQDFDELTIELFGNFSFRTTSSKKQHFSGL